ncbi:MULTISPECIES: hypothetical protein [unclassified Bartonella]|uniref:hypothetical protein n=1 Tax=unclassified Bartonella TaxID=2645622 RepID=UPI0035CE9B73
MRGKRQCLEALVTQEEGMVGKSSGKEDSLFSFVMRRMLLIIGKSNRAFRKLGVFVENKGSAMHRTFRGS